MDYKWERRTRPHLLWVSPHKTVTSRKPEGETVIRQPQPGRSEKSQQNTSHNDSTIFPKSSKRTEKVLQDQVTTKANIKALMLLIISRREAIKNLEEHCNKLQERNLQIARSIMDTERNSLSMNKELLDQQAKMRRSMIALKRWDDSQIRSVKAELTDAKKTSQTSLKGLQEHLDMVQAEVVEAQKQLHILKTYKDMEFPVKALQIADMERQLESLKEMQQKHACHIPPIVKLMATQNHRMREEINMHRKEISEVEQKNKELMKSIRELRLSRPNLRREIFPDVFLKSEKCTPDMDVHLSIPP
nr:uncharacterized protein C20orf96 homolog isoform X2 [Misgurnus anguillicaudatus]